jgi:hypothetical protein
LRLNVYAEEQNMCDFDGMFVSYRKTNSDRCLLDLGWHVLSIVDIDDKGNHPDAFTDEHIGTFPEHDYTYTSAGRAREEVEGTVD